MKAIIICKNKMRKTKNYNYYKMKMKINKIITIKNKMFIIIKIIIIFKNSKRINNSNHP